MMILETALGVFFGGLLLWWSVISGSIQGMLKKQTSDIASEVESAMNSAIENSGLDVLGEEAVERQKRRHPELYSDAP
jgi:hypothetical protein